MNKEKNNNKNKKDRPKSVDKGRRRKDGTTPDKISTPNPEEEELVAVSQSVINGEDIQSLAIKPEALEQIRNQVQESLNQISEKKKNVIVRSKKCGEVVQQRPKKSVTVAKGAPPNAPLQPFDFGGKTGPRFDNNGHVIAHSILGTLRDYKDQAQKRGELEIDFMIPEEPRVPTPLVSYAKPKVATHPKHPSGEESNALVNWQNKIMERKRQQGYISDLLQRAPEDLVMNRGDAYREKQELRYLIDRTIPAVDYGKGYRIGSEFWNQQVQIGDEDKGIHTTLSQTDRGYPPPIEHIGLPPSTQRERGLAMPPPDEPQAQAGLPWSRCKFLTQRRMELQSVMNDLDPYKPDLQQLEVVGTSRVPGGHWSEEALRYWTPVQELKEEEEGGEHTDDPLASFPNVYPEPFFGPSIYFAGKEAYWTGDSTAFKGQVAVDARVTFEVLAGKRITSFLDIVNNGTTAIYFDWKMMPKTNPFDLLTANVQRFYFDTSSGVILPGENLKFPFVFKSDKPGMFTERWEFQTRPALCGGATLVATLHGVALQEDTFKSKREELEKRLIRNVNEGMVRKIVDDIVDSIRCPDRPPSPVDCYLTEEEAFSRLNPKLYYHHDTVEELKQLYSNMVNPVDTFAEDGLSPGDGDGAVPENPLFESLPDEWDLSVDNFKQILLNFPEDNENKHGFLEKVNNAVNQLSFPAPNTLQHRLFHIGYQMMSESIEELVSSAIQIRTLMGLPEKELTDELMDEARNDMKSSQTFKSNPSARSGEGRVGQTRTPRPDSKAEAKKGGKAGKDDAKDKKGGKDGKKDAKVGKEPPTPKGKTSPAKSKHPSRTQSTADGRTTPGGTAVPTATPASQPPTTSATDRVLEAKYKERVYSQTYNMLRELLDNMSEAFEDVLTSTTD